MITPVIMAGGSGTRLWPLSRKQAPKQYRALVSERTMFEETLARVTGEEFASPMVIGSAAHQALIEEQLPDGQVVLEPFGRNTAPAALVAALAVAPKDPNGLILLLPADHHIAEPASFVDAVQRGVAAADDGFLVTLGIDAETPETGYGYIKRGAPLTDGVYRVERFVEKPDLETATSYLADGGYAWNAGIFLYRAGDLLREAELHAPGILNATRAAFSAAEREGRVIRLAPDSFGAVPDDSIDYAIMEKTDRAAVVSPVTIGWNDIGSWAAVKEFAQPTDDDDIIASQCPGTLIRREKGAPLIAAAGLKDMVVVATKDAVLILPAERSQDVKAIVEELKAKNRTDLL